jgi:hypothetical protein
MLRWPPALEKVYPVATAIILVRAPRNTLSSMTQQVNTWAPILEGNDEPTLSLLVRCGEHPPDRQEYRSRLEDAMEALIKQSPKQARKDIEEVSDPDSPGFSFLLSQFVPAEWATQIALSPQVAMLLARIDWQRVNPVQKRWEDELPCLLDILMMFA